MPNAKTGSKSKERTRSTVPQGNGGGPTELARKAAQRLRSERTPRGMSPLELSRA